MKILDLRLNMYDYPYYTVQEAESALGVAFGPQLKETNGVYQAFITLSIGALKARSGRVEGEKMEQILCMSNLKNCR